MTYGELSREELEEVVVQLEDELDEMEEQAKRIKADFANYKKQQDERREKWRTKAQKDLAQDLIRVLDNLERAIMSADDTNSTLLKGVEMVADELFNILAERGLEKVTADGDTFDPRVHNAVDTVPHEQDNVVVETRRPGYLYEDDVLREAEVVVGKDDNRDDGDDNDTQSDTQPTAQTTAAQDR